MSAKYVTSDTGLALFDACSRKQSYVGGGSSDGSGMSGSDSNAQNLMLLCLTDGLAAQYEARNQTVNEWLLVICGTLVFFMQLGFAMLYAGSVRRKNLSNTLLKNLMDCTAAAVAYYTFGYAFSFGGDDLGLEDLDYYGKATFLGNTGFFLVGSTVDTTEFFFQFALAACCVTIVAGTLAERCRLESYFAYSIFMVAFVYPVIAHSLWSRKGWLSPIASMPLGGVGAIDMGGSAVVHMTGGVAALCATIVLGAREGRFVDEKGKVRSRPMKLAGHSVSLQVMGVLILWVGYFGFNAGQLLKLPNALGIGQLAGLSATNTVLAASAGGLSALMTNFAFVLRTAKAATSSKARSQVGALYDLTKCLNGALCGIVAVGAGSAVIEPWATFFIGVIAGWMYLGGSNLLVAFRLDDTVDSIPIHFLGGAWGMIATGFFASPNRVKAAYQSDKYVGLFYTIGRGDINAVLLGNQLLAVLFVVAWTVACMYPFFYVLMQTGFFRADKWEQLAGLDCGGMGGDGDSHAGVEGDDDDLKDAIRKEIEKQKKKVVEDAKRRREREREAHARRHNQLPGASDSEDEEPKHSDKKPLT